MRALQRNAVLAGCGLAAALAVPAAAQTAEGLTVTGHAPRNIPQSLSETVSYADLDLTSARDRSVLSQRVGAAAGRICDQLGEPRPNAANLGRSCQDVAVHNASDQVRLAVADARYLSRLAAAPSAGAFGAQASAIASSRVASHPVPDTAANRARYGGPTSHAGRRTAANGN